MAELTTFRWQNQKRKSCEVIVGRQTLVLDGEGFVSQIRNAKGATEALFRDTEDRMRANANLGFAYVPMNNEALWASRLGESKAREDAAREAVRHAERDLMGRVEHLKLCIAQHKELEAERDRYRALMSGADDADVRAEAGELDTREAPEG